MFATTIAGSLPKPAWLAETKKLWPAWRASGEELAAAKKDATLLAIRRQEEAGIDIVSDGEQARQHFVHGFLAEVDGVDFDKKVRMGIRNNRYDAMVPVVTGPVSLKGRVHQVEARLARAARGIGAIADLRVASRGSSQRAIDLEIVGAQGTAHVRGGRIRSALGLREQLFVIDRQYDTEGRVIGFIFTGRGWGHGVGMCQVGAYGMAKQGFTYEQILKAYYTGIELTRLY